MSSPPPPRLEAPENATAYVNGRVYTVNDAQPWAEAFIVSEAGLFVAVGTTEAILSRARRDRMVVYDLQEQFVMPGIHDAHAHLLMAGMMQLSIVNLRNGEDLVTSSEAVRRLKSSSCNCSYAHAFHDWLLGDTFGIENYDRASIDEAFPDTPVVIQAGAGHSLLLNTVALRQSGYDVDDEPPAKGAFFARRDDGSLTGELGELAMTKAMLACPKPSAAHVRRALRHAARRLHRAGVTSCQEAASNTLMVDAFRALDRGRELRLDVYTHIVYGPEYIAQEPAQTLHRLLDAAAALRSEHVHTRFVKMMLDGVPLAPFFSQADLREDGAADPDDIYVEDLDNVVRKYDAMGMTIKIHCTGQGSTRTALNAIEAARKENPNGPRHEIAHCSGVHDDDYPRFVQLNTTAEMSPAALFNHTFTGEEAALNSWDFAKMVRHGAHMTIGSDWGVPEDPDLLWTVEKLVGVVGGSSGDDDDDDEPTSRRRRGAERLLRMLTLSGAEAVGSDKWTGSIEAGKRANFIQLDRDLSTGEEGAFREVKVRRTWFEGDLVFEEDGAS
ncbi:exoenzymes regulatory protein aepA precursor [Cordyceps javanica]|uniref:Exoenzymes regulatory protein aepA n=1 Tax=Cordyceps javanica TaxID=43265 RepID=A0A545ULQ8_9HYPO|nr:exoenzymes regulatory protein aepA precursor [Cordyceps javanica]TQW01988.1 exoenzymes regulatory protein aepA precursor [Cordyceps javanica]